MEAQRADILFQLRWAGRLSNLAWQVNTSLSACVLLLVIVQFLSSDEEFNRSNIKGSKLSPATLSAANQELANTGKKLEQLFFSFYSVLFFLSFLSL